MGRTVQGRIGQVSIVCGRIGWEIVVRGRIFLGKIDF
jgi:hypothetical protein